MKFKYYLRGAGIGIIAATVILSAAFLFQDDMSDAQIIRRALELGMVMEEGTPKTLADVPQQNASKEDLGSHTDEGQSGIDSDSDNNPSKQPDTGTDDENEPTRPDQTTLPDDIPGQDDGGESDKPAKPKADQNKDGRNENDGHGGSDGEKQGSGNTVTVTIVGGDVSRTVSAKVFEAGLVDSADEFNDFLGSNDYDNLLQPGTYEIEKGSSFEQIAKILTAR